MQESISLEVESASRTEVAEDRDTLKEGEVHVHGLKDVITDADNGIEIHVPRTRPGEGVLLSPARKIPDGENQVNPSRGGYRDCEDPRAPSRSSPTHGGVAWTLDMGGEGGEVDYVYSPSRQSQRVIQESDTVRKEGPAAGYGKGSNKERAGPGTKTKAETAAAAVTQYAQNKSVARLREASHESSSVLSAGGGGLEIDLLKFHRPYLSQRRERLSRIWVHLLCPLKQGIPTAIPNHWGLLFMTKIYLLTVTSTRPQRPLPSTWKRERR